MALESKAVEGTFCGSPQLSALHTPGIRSKRTRASSRMPTMRFKALFYNAFGTSIVPSRVKLEARMRASWALGWLCMDLGGERP